MTELFNDAAEQGLIGCLLVDNNTYSRVVDIVKPEYFFRDAHRIIYEAIKAELDMGHMVNPVLLKEVCNNPEIASLGGVTYLLEMENQVVTPLAAPDYARSVKNYYVRRMVHAISKEYTERAFQESNSENLLNELERELFQLRETEVEAKIMTIEDGVNEVIDWIENVRDGKIKPIKSGIKALDDVISGFYPGRLYVVAGRPAMGKTVLALNLAEYASKSKPVLFFNLEMSRLDMSMRLLSRHTGISAQRQTEARVSQLEIGTLREAIKNNKLIVDERSVLTIHQIVQFAKRVQKARGLGMIVIDYLGLIKTSNPNPVQAISEITVECKRMARELGVPVILLSQLNRGVESRENKRPFLSDLRDSGSIEQDADVVMLLYREEYYLQTMTEQETPKDRRVGKKQENEGPSLADRLENARGKAEIIVAKNRQGEAKTANVGYNGPGQFFHDWGVFND